MTQIRNLSADLLLIYSKMRPWGLTYSTGPHPGWTLQALQLELIHSIHQMAQNGIPGRAGEGWLS